MFGTEFHRIHSLFWLTYLYEHYADFFYITDRGGTRTMARYTNIWLTPSEWRISKIVFGTIQYSIYLQQSDKNDRLKSSICFIIKQYFFRLSTTYSKYKRGWCKTKYIFIGSYILSRDHCHLMCIRQNTRQKKNL